jgi:hypothetical protein
MELLAGLFSMLVAWVVRLNPTPTEIGVGLIVIIVLVAISTMRDNNHAIHERVYGDRNYRSKGSGKK